MLRARFIPTLLLKGRGLYKTVKFKNPGYVGDPINAVRIFNDKAVDELILLDIEAGGGGSGPDFGLISEIVSEAFIPICYGGGVTELSHFERLFKLGVEKVSVNSAATGDMPLITEASRVFGSQSVIVSIDYRRSLFGKYERYIRSGAHATGEHPVTAARRAEEAGAGEIMIYSIDRDGTQQGYDIELTRQVADSVDVPVIACGGASDVESMGEVIRAAGVSSAAAGSLFVYKGKHRAVLITYPEPDEVERVLSGPGV